MNKKIDKYGQVILDEESILELLYSDCLCFDNFFVENNDFVEQYNKNALIFGEPKLKIYEEPEISIKEYDKKRQNTWFIPEKYLKLDIDAYIKNLCNSKIELQRVEQELELFKKYNMINVVRVLIYLIDVMRKYNIVRGVGRGSSCASYCLFLIGLHKVDCIKYNIDISEFLRDK